MENTSFGPENVTEGSTNGTTGKHNGYNIYVISVFFPTFVVGLIGNGIVIFLTSCRMKTTINSIWFLNLAIADFIFILSSAVGLVLFFFEQEIATKFIKYFLSITIPLNRCASIFLLVVISLDRCLCTWMVVWAQNKRTVLRAKIICIIVWVSSITYILPLFKIFKLTATFHVTYHFIVGFVIPFLIIVSSNIAIIVRIKRLKMANKLKSYRLIIIVVLAFFICSFPFNVYCFCKLTAKKNHWRVTGQFRMPHYFTIYLVYLNSCLNPFLYVFMCDDYKKKFKESLRLVLETAFAEDHLDLRVMRQTQKDEQEKKTTIELLEM